MNKYQWNEQIPMEKVVVWVFCIKSVNFHGEACVHATFLFCVALIIKWEEWYLYLALALHALFVLLLTMSVGPAK